MGTDKHPELRFSAFSKKSQPSAKSRTKRVPVTPDKANDSANIPPVPKDEYSFQQPQTVQIQKTPGVYPDSYYPGSNEEEGFNFLEFLGIILHRKHWFLACVAVVIVLSLLSNINVNPLYQSQAKLRVVEYTGSYDILEKLKGPSKSVVATHVENLKSYQFLQRVLRVLDTNMSIQALHKLYMVSEVKDANIINITAKSSDKMFASKVANTIAISYEKYDLALKQKTYATYENWIRTQIKKKKMSLKENENSLKEFYESNPIFYDESKMKVGNYEQKVADINLELRELEEQKALINKEMSTLDSQMMKEITYDRPLQKELLSLKLEKAKLLSQFGDDHRVIRQIDDKISGIRKLLKDESEDESSTTIMVSNPRYLELLGFLHDVNTKNAILKTRKEEMDKALVLSYKVFANAPEAEMKHQRLVQEKEIQAKMVGTLEEKLQEAQLQKSSTPREIFLIEKAASVGSLIPVKKLGFLSSVLIGIALGATLCFLLEYFDATIKKSKDLSSRFGIELLGIIPHGNLHRIDKNLKFKFGSKESEIEPYRRLLANLSSQEHSRRLLNKSILITSALQGEGKTTTAAFLASTAALEGQKVLLIDADLRRSGIHRIFHLENNLGLSEYLTETKHWDHYAQDSPITNLKIITAGQSIISLTNIDNKEKLIGLINEGKRIFDLVVVDSPPILKVTDTIAIAPVIDKTLLVFRSEKTPFKAVEELLRQLSYINTRVAGGVINDISRSFWDRYYYSYYNYYEYEYYS